MSPSDKDTSLIQNYVQGSGGNEHLSINSVMIFKEIVSPMCDCCADTEATRHFLAPPVLSDEKHNLHYSRKVSKVNQRKPFFMTFSTLNVHYTYISNRTVWNKPVFCKWLHWRLELTCSTLHRNCINLRCLSKDILTFCFLSLTKF